MKLRWRLTKPTWSLRALFVGLTCCALLSGVGALHVKAKLREAATVAEILRLGGRVVYDFQFEGRKEPYGPGWLRAFLGEHFFSRVVLVAFFGRPITDEDITRIDIASLGHLEQLGIEDANISEVSLGQIAKLPRLTTLNLAGNQLDGSGLAMLNGLKRLDILNLSRTNVTDKALLSCTFLHQLESLDLSSTPVTGEFIGDWVLHSRLNTLGLDESQVTGEHLQRLSGAPNLEYLRIWDCMRAENLKLADLPKLASINSNVWFERVELSRLPCLFWEPPRASVVILSDMPRIERLYLSGCTF